MSSPLTIQLFGPLRVLVGAEPMPRLRTRSVEWLLALLVLRHDRPVARAWLAGTLWPDSLDVQARENLRHDLVTLRRALGPEAARLQSPTRDTLCLDVDGADVDVVRFDRALRRGGADALRDAVALCAGPLLEGCYEEWAMPEREARARQCLEALEELADEARRRGDMPEAVRLLRRAALLDPLRDSTVRALMTCLEDAGDPAAAGDAFRQFRSRLHAEMAAAPDTQTILLAQQIRARARQAARAPASPSPVPNSPADPEYRTAPPVSLSARVPMPLTTLIGREADVAAVQERLRKERLITLVGAGGVGKTRLAMEVAARAAEGAREVVWLELAPLAAGTRLLPALAAVLALRPERGDDETLCALLAGHFDEGETLLALDNCEHVVEAAAEIVQGLLSRCPGLRVLATSRQRLGVTGEVVWRVPSLPFPEAGRETGPLSAASPLGYPAVRLFVERAAAVSPGFRLDDAEDEEAAGRLCRRLDGIPLALEMAAARANVLSVREIASRMDDRFRLLAGGSRTASPRHRTLQALIDWSYEQLPEAEADLLRRLSVFAGGWTLDAAEAVSGPARGDVLDGLASLVDRSLVLAEKTPQGVRYRMLETVREYGGERLRAAGEEPAARALHAAYFLTFAEQTPPHLISNEIAWLERLETEHDNLRGAIAWFAMREETLESAVRLAGALAAFWNTRGHWHERLSWLVGLALRSTPPTQARSRLLSDAGWVAAEGGDIASARQIFDERAQLCRHLGDRWGVADALVGLAGLLADDILAGSEHDPARSRVLAEESLTIMREVDHRQGIGQCCYVLGRLARLRGDAASARAFWAECRAIDSSLGVKGGHVLPMLGELALESGDPQAAGGHFRVYLDECVQVGNRWGQAWALRGLAESDLRHAEGNLVRAARLLGVSLALYESGFGPPNTVTLARYEALRHVLRERLGAAALEAAWAEGRAMTPEAVLQVYY